MLLRRCICDQEVERTARKLPVISRSWPGFGTSKLYELYPNFAEKVAAESMLALDGFPCRSNPRNRNGTRTAVVLASLLSCQFVGRWYYYFDVASCSQLLSARAVLATKTAPNTFFGLPVCSRLPTCPPPAASQMRFGRRLASSLSRLSWTSCMLLFGSSTSFCPYTSLRASGFRAPRP